MPKTTVAAIALMAATISTASVATTPPAVHQQELAWFCIQKPTGDWACYLKPEPRDEQEEEQIAHHVGGYIFCSTC